ncbi:MAG: hypothetical protein V7K98_21660 [Nostoc sp.]
MSELNIQFLQEFHVKLTPMGTAVPLRVYLSQPKTATIPDI